MITKQQFDDAVKQQKEAQEIINAYGKQEIQNFKARWERFEKNNEFFSDEDLIYAADARCLKCQAGMAYPKNCDLWHQWTCSNVLKGIGTDGGHTAYPFSFYEIKSEKQPSANGATTRPK